MLNAFTKKANRTTTENDAVSLYSTGNDCLDLFATIGALREAEEATCISRFVRAYIENADLAMKILFFARDVREGLGERRVFRCLLRWLANHKPESVRKNLNAIVEFGRYDDLLALLATQCHDDMIAFVANKLNADLEALAKAKPVSLLAKWLPSVNASSPKTVASAKILAKALGMNQASYRKKLSALRQHLHLLENNLRVLDYSFDYQMQPSRALLKYRKAFLRHDKERYQAFLRATSQGQARLNTSNVLPSDIVTSILNADNQAQPEELAALNATWNALEDFTNGDNALVVMDGSASMYASSHMPAAVALSLAIYYAERNTGLFKGHFITFSQHPRLVKIKGETIVDKVLYCQTFNECANTNLQKVFELILQTALTHNSAARELPKTLYIISDMEFDRCTEDADLTNFEYAKKLFEEHGYTLPRLVFWNVDNRNEQQPVSLNEKGVILISGSSPIIFKLLKSGKFTPVDFMLETLASTRYEHITA